MRLLVINPNSTASMTEKIGIAAHACGQAGTEMVAVNPVGGPVSIEGYYRRGAERSRPSARDPDHPRLRRGDHRLFRRHRPGCCPLPDRPPGHRHRRGGLPFRLDDREQVLGRHDAGAVGPGAGTQPAPATAWPRAAPGCGRRKWRCWNWNIPGRTPATGSAPKSAAQ